MTAFDGAYTGKHKLFARHVAMQNTFETQGTKSQPTAPHRLRGLVFLGVL